MNFKLEEIARVSEGHRAALKKLKISTVLDLLYYFPVRYGDTSTATTIDKLVSGAHVAIFGRIIKASTKKAFRSNMPMAEAVVEDDTGKVKCIWFNQAYIAKMYTEGSLVKIEGVISARGKDKDELYFSNPHIESVARVPDAIGDSLFVDGGKESEPPYPIYRESKGITSNWIYHTLQKIFKDENYEKLQDPIPESILTKYNLPSLKTALVWIHAPRNLKHAEAARKRFAFEEIFLLQLERQMERNAVMQFKPYVVDIPQETIDTFTSKFPFELTDGQRKAITDILRDFKSGHPMSRLLHGDVGSGKTAVAAATTYALTMTRPMKDRDTRQSFGHLQTAYMVPTEILAKQHFDSFIKFFQHLPINIGLITGSGCRKFPSKVSSNFRNGNNGSTEISRNQLLKWVANGEIPILIGTHALIQKSVIWKHLGYVVIDEQHRFGTAQRKKLVRKDNSFMPHLLSMTATPIPRTLALTFYGDLDLTVLDEMPHGRKKVITGIVLPKHREEVYEKIRKEIQAGRQAYVICPRIDEADADKSGSLKLRSAVEEMKRLKRDVFPEYNLDVMHSKMTPKEKDLAMKKFSSGATHILVSTSVVEVGVSVENATVMLIEGAERFGLAQLHQLRGRVVRSNHQAYCYVLAENNSDKTVERLKALSTAKNGFELAEYDLALRGAGALTGDKQWGITDIGMEAIRNLRLVESARTEAKMILQSDPDLATHPLLQKELDSRGLSHFE